MKDIFVPYVGNKPAAMYINGHKLLILSTEREAFESQLEVLGADSVKRLKTTQSPKEQEKIISKLAKKIKGGVVISPNNMELHDLIKNLEHELPWVQ